MASHELGRPMQNKARSDNFVKYVVARSVNFAEYFVARSDNFVECRARLVLLTLFWLNDDSLFSLNRDI